MVPLLSEEFIEKIRKHFDLNLYEAKAWLVLAEKRVASASMISKLAQIPKSRVYDILESLEAKGFVDKLSVKPLKYEMAAISDIIERVKRHYEEESKKKIDELERFIKTDEFTKLKALERKEIEEEESAPKLYEGDAAMYKITKQVAKANAITIISSYSKLEEKIKSISRAIKKAKSNGARINVFVFKDKEESSENMGLDTRNIDVDLGDVIVKDGKEVFLFSKNKILHIKDDYIASRFIELAKMHSK
jgi:sugar-specific transcriptional regulator TrmB